MLGPAYTNMLMQRKAAAQRAAYDRPQFDTTQDALNFGAGMFAMVPGIGDAMGLAADLNHYREDPSARTWGNFGLTGLGLLPLVPGMIASKPKQLRLPLRRAPNRGPIAYHGSTEPKPFVPDPDLAVETRGAAFLASNPDVAHTFTLPREYGEAMFYDAAGREIAPGAVSKLRVNLKRPKELSGAEAQRFIDDTTFQGSIVEQAKRDGYDGVIARDVLEGIGERYRGDVYAVFNQSSMSPAKRKVSDP